MPIVAKSVHGDIVMEMTFENSWFAKHGGTLDRICMNSKSVIIEKEDGQVTTYTYKEN